MKRKLIILSSIVSIVIIASVVTFKVKGSKVEKSEQNNTIEKYAISQSDRIIINGIVLPEKTENINIDPSKGNVFKVLVNNGQVVKAGDILFTYKNTQILEQIETLNEQISSIKNEKKSLDNVQVQQSDPAEVQIKNIENQIKTLKAKEITKEIAPIGGKVNIGDPKDQTKPYITIQTTTFQVKGIINEKDQVRVKENQVAEVYVYSTNKTLAGKVKTVGSSPVTSENWMQGMVSGGSNLSYYAVEIMLDSQEELVNGFHVQTSVKLSEEVKIPNTSVFDDGGKKYVFKIQDRKLAKQEIKCDENKSSSEVIVRSGLKENDTIVLSPAPNMKEGDIIE